MKNNYRPEIRFSGFAGDWEHRKLGDIAEFNPKSNVPEQFEYVDLESVVGINLISHRTEQKETAPSRAQRLAKQGDVFFQTVRPYQKNNYLFDLPFDNYVFSTGYAQMRPYLDSYYLLSRLQEERFVSTVLDRCTGTSYPAINSNDLAQIEISVPTLKEEQTKIGDFFKQLDETITLHEQELTTLKQTKQGFLQKMFPKEEESVPEVRFPGFTGEWEQRRLGDIYQFKYGQFNNNPDNGGEYPIYGANGVIGGYHEYNAEDSIVIGHMGAYAGHVLWASGKHFVTYNGTIGFPKIMDFDKKFGYHMIQHLNIPKITAGSGQPFVSYADLESIKINIPINIKEQTSIGKMLDQLDNLITLHQRELDVLKETKKAFLQKMFA